MKADLELTLACKRIDELDAQMRGIESAMAIENIDLVNKNLKEILELIGAYYVDESVIDETGMRLVLADMNEREGRYGAAANLRHRVARERLELLRRTCGAKGVLSSKGREARS